MIKILNSNDKNFYHKLGKFLIIRKNKVQSKSVSVKNIINDVKKKWR